MKLSLVWANTIALLGLLVTAAPKGVHDESSMMIEESKNDYNTVSTAGGADFENWIAIDMYGERQHTGQVHHERMYNEVSSALKSLCNANGCRRDSVRINAIEYDADGKLATNSHCTIKVTDAKWPGGETVRNALIDHIAHTYEATTKSDKNCYHVTLDKSGNKVLAYFCQVGRNVDATFRSAGSATEAYGYMKASFEFNSRTKKDGVYSCGRPDVLASVEDYARKNIAPQLVNGLPGTYFNDWRAYCCTTCDV